MNKLLLFALLILLATRAVAAPPAELDAEAALKEAESLAVHGDTAAAIAAYEVLVGRGTDFASLRYNLGTLYLEEGDIGRAVLHLQTALRDRPRDEDIRHNLAVAKQGMKDQLEGVGPGLPFAVALGRELSPGAASLLFWLALVLFAVIFAAWPWLPHRAARLLGAVSLALVLVGAGAIGVRLLAESEVQAVVLEETPARKGPALSAPSSFTAHPGLTGSVRERQDGAVRLRLDNGVEAWLDETALGFIE